MHYTFGQCIGTFDELLGYKCIIALFFNSVHIENSGEILGYLYTITLLFDSVLGRDLIPVNGYWIFPQMAMQCRSALLKEKIICLVALMQSYRWNTEPLG